MEAWIGQSLVVLGETPLVQGMKAAASKRVDWYRRQPLPLNFTKLTQMFGIPDLKNLVTMALM
jgi:hypothetical protein